MKVCVVFGTRPEAIKLAPVILELQKHPRKFVTRIIVTAQHRQMLDQVLRLFNIKPDIDLNLMEQRQTLAGFASRALVALDEGLRKEKPNILLVQGDTTTTWIASLAAFYNRIKIGHVEAGLRTGNRFSPFPEEMNRILTTHLADWHFAPTAWAAKNLIAEGIPRSRVFVTGNTVVDALYLVVDGTIKVAGSAGWSQSAEISGKIGGRDRKKVLITGHSRESFGMGLRNICRAIGMLARRFPDHSFVYPVHLNPNVRKHVLRMLRGEKNIILTDPLDYVAFVRLMAECRLVLTDSGGIQEEAPALGKPVLVMRDTTERPEAAQAGAAKLVGTDPLRIVREASLALTRPNKIASRRAKGRTQIYGDGHAAVRIVRILSR